jgi:hypothetical protein
VPSYNHRVYALNKIKHEFRSNRAAPAEDIPMLLALADTQMETLNIQTQHLIAMQSTYLHEETPKPARKAPPKK